jgi:hypothetical protein
MNQRLFFGVAACVCFFCFGFSRAGDSTDVKFTPFGWGAVEVGQIESGFYEWPSQDIGAIDHVWQQRAFGKLGYDVVYKNNLEINISGEGLYAFSTPQIGKDPQTMEPRSFFYVKTANATYSFLNSEQYGLKLQLGFFPYKYSPDVRNLGEYLFRSNAYPLLVYTDFDWPKADMLGARAHFQYESSNKFLLLQDDFLLNSELYTVPVQDWSLSDVFSAKLLDAITVGGGVSFCNLLSVYQGKYMGGIAVEKYFNLDSATARAKGFYLGNADGDSEFFDWKSTKLMGRVSFDLKKLLPWDIFGKNDLMLYGESDIIGLKNYPKYFTDLKDRIFYSVGFNIPGFKIFDVVNFEMEYCRDTSAFSDYNLLGGATPYPFPVGLNTSNSSLGYNVNRNQVRLSAYIKKSVLDGRVDFVFQCARDHKRINFYYFDYNYMSFMETLPSGNNWWWVFKTEFNF